MENKPVEAGKLLDFINKLISSLDKSFANAGMKIDKSQTSDDGTIYLRVSTKSGNHSFMVRCVPEDAQRTLYELSYKTDKGSISQKDSMVKKEDITKRVNSFVKKFYGKNNKVESLEEDLAEGEEKKLDLNSSKTMNIILKRITSASGSEIHLTGIKSNYDATEAWQDLQTVMNDDSFLSSVPDEGGSYEISSDGESLDVQVCENVICSPIDSLESILPVLYAFYLDVCHQLHVSRDVYSDFARSCCMDWKWTLSDQIDKVYELIVEMGGHPKHPVTIINSFCPITYDPDLENTDTETFKAAMAIRINGVINALELYYCQFPHDIQKMLDDWIRMYKHIAGYTLRPNPAATVNSAYPVDSEDSVLEEI